MRSESHIQALEDPDCSQMEIILQFCTFSTASLLPLSLASALCLSPVLWICYHQEQCQEHLVFPGVWHSDSSQLPLQIDTSGSSGTLGGWRLWPQHEPQTPGASGLEGTPEKLCSLCSNLLKVKQIFSSKSGKENQNGNVIKAAEMGQRGRMEVDRGS